MKLIRFKNCRKNISLAYSKLRATRKRLTEIERDIRELKNNISSARRQGRCYATDSDFRCNVRKLNSKKFQVNSLKNEIKLQKKYNN